MHAHALRAFLALRAGHGHGQAAEIDPASTKYSWKLFNFTWNNATPGDHTLVSRVIDENGKVQLTPEEIDQLAEFFAAQEGLKSPHHD